MFHLWLLTLYREEIYKENLLSKAAILQQKQATWHQHMLEAQAGVWLLHTEGFTLRAEDNTGISSLFIDITSKSTKKKPRIFW